MASVVTDELIGPFLMPETHSPGSGTGGQPSSFNKTMIYWIHPNTPMHGQPAKAPKDKRMMGRPPFSHDRDHIENLFARCKRKIYGEGNQKKSNEELTVIGSTQTP